MIEESATVVAVQGDQVLVQTQRQSSCQACSVKKGCGTSVLSKVIGTRVSQMSVPNRLQAEVGDEVLLGIEENALVKGSLLVYALPLILMLVFGLVAEVLASGLGWHSELPVVLAAISGFALSAGLVRLAMLRSAFSRQIQPRMLRILSHGKQGHDMMLAP
jgi:sigma-E factor negative regulatory protein RseC